jgi:hypothetical protein
MVSYRDTKCKAIYKGDVILCPEKVTGSQQLG